MTLFLLGAGIACLLRTGTPPATAGQLAFSRDEALQRISTKLTFSDRVAYEYAIEEVYWRHRNWPKDNPGPKPSLDAIVSKGQIEQKIEDYLSQSKLVREQRGWAITASELQTEMERMASHTRQPEVLRELFQALGNDPFVIAECLARPILADRLIADLPIGRDESPSRPSDSVANSARSRLTSLKASLVAPRPAVYKLPEIFPLDCTGDTWTATTMSNVPDVRWRHTAVWTGSEMIIWGGDNLTVGVMNTGGSYSPATDSWMATSTTNAPTSRAAHTAVWTGTEIIVWGGADTTGELNTGGIYNPVLNSWESTRTINAPFARGRHTAVWTGSEMIIWGGVGCGSNCILNTGARYDPSMDTWTAISTTNAPTARDVHTAVWTGSEMIVWGGADGIINHTYLHTGGRYNPNTDSWTPTGLANVPLGRFAHTGVWTGSEMIVWGGVDETFNDTNTGGRYNPSTDSWVATNSGTGPLPRNSQSAVWTGTEMIIWGGSSPTTEFNNGGRYSPATDTWTATSTANAPPARDSHTVVWTGSEMIVWGGANDVGFLNTGGMYCAQPSTPIVQSAVSRKTHGFAGDFDIPLPLNGTPGIECRSSDFIGDHTIVVTFLANVSVNGTPQAAVTSGIGAIGSGGTSNGGVVVTSGNVVTIPLTNVANAQTINVTLNNVNGSTNVTIPMSVLLGDVNGNGAVNASDVALTKSRSGQLVAAATFRSDVNANGSINASDVALVKSLAGTGLP